MLPTASALATLLLNIATGMLKGTMAAMTPYGSRMVKPRVVGPSGTVRPVDASSVSWAFRSQRTFISSNTILLMDSGLPLSVDSSRANSSACSVKRLPTFFR